MHKVGLLNYRVEVASSNASDFEVTELYLRLVKPEFAQYLMQKKRYRERPLEGGGTVLLPPYHLEYDETVTFGRRKRFFFPTLYMEGIRL